MKPGLDVCMFQHQSKSTTNTHRLVPLKEIEFSQKERREGSAG